MKRLVAKVPDEDLLREPEDDPAVLVLANRRNRFAGVEEVLLVSNKVLQDVQSSLKEINEGQPGTGGTRGDAKSLQNAIEYQCLSVREANAAVEKAVRRASQLMRDFHKETSTASTE